MRQIYFTSLRQEDASGWDCASIHRGQSAEEESPLWRTGALYTALFLIYRSTLRTRRRVPHRTSASNCHTCEHCGSMPGHF